ncbi:MAG: hypothetical protein ACE367_16760 [Acidimicrobiales bacterium]
MVYGPSPSPGVPADSVPPARGEQGTNGLRILGICLVCSAPFTAFVSFAFFATVLGEERLEDEGGITVPGWMLMAVPTLVGVGAILLSRWVRMRPVVVAVPVLLVGVVLVLAARSSIRSDEGVANIGAGFVVFGGVAAIAVAWGIIVTALFRRRKPIELGPLGDGMWWALACAAHLVLLGCFQVVAIMDDGDALQPSESLVGLVVVAMSTSIPIVIAIAAQRMGTFLVLAAAHAVSPIVTLGAGGAETVVFFLLWWWVPFPLLATLIVIVDRAWPTSPP